ncbi:MAG: MOSC domain-containing protein [Candidatus Promineifilaceae bacterium]|nr:MOSC domain-containing protein [Candidatus Promineifilaceae bacterium]
MDRELHGHIFQLNRSDGGVPKLAVAAAPVSPEGLAGDRQRDLRHHGGPERALCLFPLEHILELQREGHPIYPGAIGENVTIVGIAWEEVTPGRRLRLGDSVEILVTSYTTPCSNIAPAFSDGYFNRVHQKKYPGRARVYARVTASGTLSIGDPVVLLAAD